MVPPMTTIYSPKKHVIVSGIPMIGSAAAHETITAMVMSAAKVLCLG